MTKLLTTVFAASVGRALTEKHMVSTRTMCFASSAMDEAISKDCLRGRPFGGISIFVNNTLAQATKLIKAASCYVIVLIGQTIVINAYLPCVSSPCREQEFVECLANIMNDMAEVNFTNVIFGGDLNTDFGTGDKLCNALFGFAEDKG